MTAGPATRADGFEAVSGDIAARWQRFGAPGTGTFPALLGLVVEEVRLGYCRLRLPFRSDLKQAGGIVHGGAIASLLDSSLVPAIGATLPPRSQYSTVDLHVQFVGALVDDDAVAEGWIVHQGGRTVFGRSEAVAASTGRLVASATMTFNVKPNA